MILYNPEWRKQGKTWSLINDQKLGIVESQVTRDYKWEVFLIEGGPVLENGVARDLPAAQTAVEKALGYQYFVEEQYLMSKGCRCGSCSEPTGKWLVSNRDDTVDLLFDSEGEAIAWVVNKHAEDKE